MNPWTRRASVIVLLSILTIGAAVASVSHWALQRYRAAIGILEPRLERMAGLVDASTDIQSALQQAQQQVGPWLHPGGPNATTEVQQRVRQLIDGAGLTTVALQAAQSDAAAGELPRVRLSVTVTGPWPAALRWLQSLPQQRPALWVQSMNMMREGRDAPSEPQIVRVTLQIDAPLRPEGTP